MNGQLSILFFVCLFKRRYRKTHSTISLEKLLALQNFTYNIGSLLNTIFLQRSLPCTQSTVHIKMSSRPCSEGQCKLKTAPLLFGKELTKQSGNGP